MKRLAFVAAAAAMVVAGLLTGTAAGRSDRDRAAQYPRSGIVTAIDRDADVVTFTDGAGLDWSFYGVDDWMLGDGVATLMDDNGTATVYDDVILSVRYTG